MKVKLVYDNDKDKEFMSLIEVKTPFFIDYIDMNEESRKDIINIWNECLKCDRSKIQIVGFTPLNLLEVTRKHMWS